MNKKMFIEGMKQVHYRSFLPNYLVDKEYKLHYFSKHLEDEYGLDLGDICYKKIYCRKEPCDDCIMKKTFEEQSFQILEGECKLNCRNQVKYIKRIGIPSVLDGEYYCLVIQEDLTEEKIKENELKSEIEALQNSVHNLNLIMKNKDRYYTNLIHDINKQANDLKSICALIPKRSFFSNLNKEKFDLAHKILSRMDLSTKKLLKFNEINEAEVDLENKVFNFHSVINDIRLKYNFLIKERKLKFRTNIDSNVRKKYIGDSFKIKQVINNILENSFQYTMKGSIDMNIYKIDEEKDRDIVKVIIKDTGIGMTDEQIERVTNRYYRISNSDSSTEQVGLGLAISKELVLLMNGELSIEAERNKGTVVSIILPLALEKSHRDNDKVNDNKRKLLLVGDIIINKYILNFKLKRNYKVYKSSDGEEALSDYYKIKPDVVIIDMMAKKKNGFEFYDEIYNNNTYVSPIIAVSNPILDTEEEYLKSYGFDGYIAKPINERVLQKYLREF